jgi:DNA-binding LacI/PurR family transcriptional regulator
VRYSLTILINTIGRILTEAGYAFSVATFSLDPNDSLTLLRSELLRATELVIALFATPNVHRHLAESGVKHILVCGDRPEFHGSHWIRFSSESAVKHFAEHCVRTGVRHVVQVRFDGDAMIDAQPALAERGIDSSWLTLSFGDANGWRYVDLAKRACEMFGAMSRKRIRDLFLFWNTYVAQGAVMAFLNRGIRLPEDVKVVVRADTEIAPVYTKPFTRFEVDPVKTGEKVANFAIAVLAKGRIPRPPIIPLQYVFGATFPF